LLKRDKKKQAADQLETAQGNFPEK